MSTYTRILYQLVFGSKDYTAFLMPSNQDILFKYIAGVLKNKSCYPYIVGGYKNHIHIIFDLHPSSALSDLIRDLKRSSSDMMKNREVDFQEFPGWQVGYGAFTYSSNSLRNLINYVSNQEVHHMKESYKEELTKLCIENGVQFNEDYLLT